jgi:hypothetical protein
VAKVIVETVEGGSYRERFDAVKLILSELAEAKKPERCICHGGAPGDYCSALARTATSPRPARCTASVIFWPLPSSAACRPARPAPRRRAGRDASRGEAEGVTLWGA